MRGQASENATGMILRADKKRKNPTNIKKAAKKRYRERLLSFIANTAQPDPRITKKKANKTETREVPARCPRRKALPKNMSKRPIIKTNQAMTRRVAGRCIFEEGYIYRKIYHKNAFCEKGV
jgi:hypothetical protein